MKIFKIIIFIVLFQVNNSFAQLVHKKIYSKNQKITNDYKKTKLAKHIQPILPQDMWSEIINILIKKKDYKSLRKLYITSKTLNKIVNNLVQTYCQKLLKIEFSKNIAPQRKLIFFRELYNYIDKFPDKNARSPEQVSANCAQSNKSLMLKIFIDDIKRDQLFNENRFHLKLLIKQLSKINSKKVNAKEVINILHSRLKSEKNKVWLLAGLFILTTIVEEYTIANLEYYITGRETETCYDIMQNLAIHSILIMNCTIKTWATTFPTLDRVFSQMSFDNIPKFINFRGPKNILNILINQNSIQAREINNNSDKIWDIRDYKDNSKFSRAKNELRNPLVMAEIMSVFIIILFVFDYHLVINKFIKENFNL